MQCFILLTPGHLLCTGDPPNIIIGSSFDEIGFVDFIVNVLPCIFLLCIPVSLGLVVWVYRYYLTTSTMKVLDTAKLKTAYPIYDEPRLMIAGTVTAFVIIMFFLHPVHHKDTAWIALLGAFITIAFTNPHDVQDAVCPGYLTEFFGMDFSQHSPSPFF
jgi:Na+/H+ antiporter NhaD/arsenite permease-like protein